MAELLVISMSTAVSRLDMIHPYAVCVSQERNLTDSSVKESARNHLSGRSTGTVAWMWISESMCHSTGNRMNQDVQSDVS